MPHRRSVSTNEIKCSLLETCESAAPKSVARKSRRKSELKIRLECAGRMEGEIPYVYVLHLFFDRVGLGF